MALIAGVDEAGRGPLAGPVVAAAVILPEQHLLKGLADSKTLPAGKRDRLFEQIMETALAVGVGQVEPAEIDRINILRATQQAMQKALGSLAIRPHRALIDGFGLANQVIPNTGVVRGDATVACISAASIIAKVTRDRLMRVMDTVFPEYGFARHKGYGTPTHLEALKRWKACPIHRRSFRPVKAHLPTLKWLRQERRVGVWGERLAALELLRRGYSVTALNVSCSPFGEIDIVAETGHERVFVEVKTITREQLGTPEEKVDRHKLGRLQNAIEMYLMNCEDEKDIRLDVITVRLGSGRPEIRVYQGIELD